MTAPTIVFKPAIGREVVEQLSNNFDSANKLTRYNGNRF